MAGILCKKTILIIDDDVRMLQALEKVLAKEGATVSCHDLAVDAFRILATFPEKFNLLITDLRMPFVSGAKTVTIVHDVLPQLPIIVLTAYGAPDIKTECLSKGATAFVEKPVEASYLIELVAKVLEIDKASDQNKCANSGEVKV
jgi:DNA-binding NtrC family response regulator